MQTPAEQTSTCFCQKNPVSGLYTLAEVPRLHTRLEVALEHSQPIVSLGCVDLILSRDKMVNT